MLQSPPPQKLSAPDGARAAARRAYRDEDWAVDRTSPLIRDSVKLNITRSPARELQVGTTLRSRYVLEEVIGEGGDSIVFRATDTHRQSVENALDACVAIKVLRPESRESEGALQRLKREFRQMQLLTHPGIARVFDLDHDGDVWFISMELVAAPSVDAWLQQSSSRSPGQRLKLIRLCCEALQYAHSRGVLHGDLKPSNVLIAESGAVRLIDFGSAADAGPEAQRSCDADPDFAAAATVSHASPQVLDGEAPEVRDDVFSLACLSYAVLADGARPFEGMSSLVALRTGAQPAPIPGISAVVWQALLRGLAAERDGRPASVQEFLNELIHAHLSSCPVPEPAPQLIKPKFGALVMVPGPVRAPRRRWRAGRRRGLWLGAAIILAVIATALWFAAGRQEGAANVPSQPAAVPVLSAAATPPEVASPSPEAAAPPAKPAELKPVVRANPGLVTFESSAISVPEAQPLVAIPIKRVNSTRGAAIVGWTIERSSAEAHVDYAAVDRRVVRFIEGQSERSIFIPLSKPGTVASSGRLRTFTVALLQVSGGAALGPVSRVTVTISGGSRGDDSGTLARNDSP